ncbi:MAG: DUF1566 domain-containing protein [Alphaproteobacteria bacterium]|nr:DUF1566 domain-containing protein [Alphaproteobacteria bacterium]
MTQRVGWTGALRLAASLAVCVLFMVMVASPALAIDNERTTVGSPCGTSATPPTPATANGADWDAIMQCNGSTWQRAALMIGATATGCDSGHAGMLQWTGTSLQLCDGSGWGVLSVARGPNALSFTDQTGVALSTTATSNALTLSGTFGTVSATCGTGCTSIARNGTWGGTTVTGFTTGDTIAISQLSSSAIGTATTATVTVGTTTSSAWSVTTTTDACAVASPAAGTVCADGSVYVGLSPDGNVKMYTTRCDQGMTWSGSACTGTRSTYMWGTYGTLTNINSTTTGRANTTALVTNYSTLNDGYTTGVPAASTCENLTVHGKSDWYLPAKDELHLIWTSAGSSSAGVTSTYSSSFDVSGTYSYWSSSEYAGNPYGAWIERFSDGNQYAGYKNNSRLVRCVRR